MLFLIIHKNSQISLSSHSREGYHISRQVVDPESCVVKTTLICSIIQFSRVTVTQSLLYSSNKTLYMTFSCVYSSDVLSKKINK